MELMKLGRALALVSLPLMLTACVSSSDHKALQAQVSQMNRQMNTSQTSLHIVMIIFHQLVEKMKLHLHYMF